MKQVTNIMAEVDAIRDIQPPPIFASSRLFPPDKGLRFECDGREYLCAGPAVWDGVEGKVEEIRWNGRKPYSVFILSGIDISDLAEPRNAALLDKVTTALARASA